MESKSTQSQEMISLVVDIMHTIEYSSQGEDHFWYKYFNVILERLNKPHSLNILARDIVSVYGGMGSFSDLVLHKSRMPLQEENDKLEQLRHDLYILCKKISDENIL
ncbi:MAG: hypothetical protein AB7D28_10825 [Candidatus Berkiella sp.]